MRSFFVTHFVLMICFFIQRVRCEANEIGYCLRDPTNPTLSECVGRKAINFLQRIEESDNFTIIRGLTVAKDENVAQRSIMNFLDQDPVDFRGIMENAGAIFSQRALQWDLHGLYPGLQLRIGPSAETTSVLEFVMDPQLEIDERNYLIEEPSTARIITKKFLLPFLLGLKFNLVAIIPLIFGAVIFLCQKAAILAKLALFLSGIFGIGGALGLGGALGGGGIPSFIGHGGGYGLYGKPHGHGHGHGLGAFADSQFDGYVRNGRRVKFDQPREFQENDDEIRTPVPDHFYDYEKNVLLQDRNFNVYERNSQKVQNSDGSNSGEKRNNFVWKPL